MAPPGRERKKGEDRVREKGILDITIGRVHMSGLSNGRKQTEGGRNGLEGKKKFDDGTKVRSNFLVACRL